MDGSPKNHSSLPAVSPLPTCMVLLELSQAEQVVPQVLFLQETFLPSYLISSPGVLLSTPMTDKILNKNCKVNDPDLVLKIDRQFLEKFLEVPPKNCSSLPAVSPLPTSVVLLELP